jgi:hypothetical protein
MFKYCGLFAENPSITRCTNLLLFTHRSLKFNDLRINFFYTQFYERLIRLFMHMKNSLTYTVRVGLSTISTQPTITITDLKFKYLYIRDWSRTR